MDIVPSQGAAADTADQTASPPSSFLPGSVSRPGNPMLQRMSSRSGKLSHSFLRERLRGARTYKRIAGYFRSSIFEVAAEELAEIDEVRIVCNADLDARDVRAAQAVFEAGLRERWSEGGPEVDSFLHRERYAHLYAALKRGNVKVRVLARDVSPFLHGKAGLIVGRDGSRTAFMGSVNETREGWSENYEILWEDISPEGADWVDAEFEWLWAQGRDLPHAIVEEVGRLSRRVEHQTPDLCPPNLLAPAAIVESPMYRRGDKLQPWQRAFVEIVAKHRRVYGKARLLLADEVGLGKTLSLASAALYLTLLGDGPVLLLVPATLTLQWQSELWDHLGIPSAIWTRDKTWLDHNGHEIRTRGPEDVARCPCAFGIVSTGLIAHGAPEADALLARKYGTVILDEGHKARRELRGDEPGDANKLLRFMNRIAARGANGLIGTATPIQTHVSQVWDLMEVLASNAEHVLGDAWSPWRRWNQAFPLLTGVHVPQTEEEAWQWLRNPLPDRAEHSIFDHVRRDLQIPTNRFVSNQGHTEIDPFTRDDISDLVVERRNGTTFFQRHNPLIRHVVLRRRSLLEEKGLMPRIAVNLHPSANAPTQLAALSNGRVETSDLLAGAIEDAELYTKARVSRARKAGNGGGQGFIKAILMQRIGSSAAAGMATALKILGADRVRDDDEEDAALIDAAAAALSPEERTILERMVAKLSAIGQQGGDPKYKVVHHYLVEQGWLELGCITFSQYFDTADWIAQRLADGMPEEPVALYAGAGKSRILVGGLSISVERDVIKAKVRSREVRLVVATDAACEGLNLQTLGTLINVDLPWNPSRLEQRIGRVKRFGQIRDEVDVLNLVYRDSWDERVLAKISGRLKDRYDLFGGLPDVIEDEWIEDIERYEEHLDAFIRRHETQNAFDLKYGATMEPVGEDWALCAEVLSRSGLEKVLAKPW